METSKTIVTFIVLVILVVLGGWALVNYPKSKAGGPAININATTTGLSLPGGPSVTGSSVGVTGTIRVAIPTPNSIITSPVSIQGEAQGTWFFEASAPATVTDEEGNTIGMAALHANADWMTTDFVPFSGQVTFTSPGYGTRGYLVISNDNPSGLPENAKSIRIPVRFK